MRAIKTMGRVLNKLKMSDPQADEMSLVVKAFDVLIKPILVAEDTINFQNILVKHEIVMTEESDVSHFIKAAAEGSNWYAPPLDSAYWKHFGN